MKTQSNYIDFKEFIPYPDVELVLNTNYGMRYGYFDYMTWMFRLTDCNHPLQNSVMATNDVLGWKYRKNAERYPPVINLHERRLMADAILSTVKLTFWDKLKIKLKL